MDSLKENSLHFSQSLHLNNTLNNIFSLVLLVNFLVPVRLEFFLYFVTFGFSNSLNVSLSDFVQTIPETERFFHIRRREAHTNIMADNRTLKEYDTPSTEEPHAVIAHIVVDANNFELKPVVLI